MRLCVKLKIFFESGKTRDFSTNEGKNLNKKYTKTGLFVVYCRKDMDEMNILKFIEYLFSCSINLTMKKIAGYGIIQV